MYPDGFPIRQKEGQAIFKKKSGDCDTVHVEMSESQGDRKVRPYNTLLRLSDRFVIW